MDIKTVDCSTAGRCVRVKTRYCTATAKVLDENTWTDTVGKKVTSPLYDEYAKFLKKAKALVYTLNSVAEGLKSVDGFEFDGGDYMGRINSDWV